MSETSPSLPADPMAASAARWLASQPEGNVAIAREILRRREALRAFRGDTSQAGDGSRESGFIAGLVLALSYCRERPGDISQTGAGGFVDSVEMADQLVAKAAAEESAR